MAIRTSSLEMYSKQSYCGSNIKILVHEALSTSHRFKYIQHTFLNKSYHIKNHVKLLHLFIDFLNFLFPPTVIQNLNNEQLLIIRNFVVRTSIQNTFFSEIFQLRFLIFVTIYLQAKYCKINDKCLFYRKMIKATMNTQN